MDRTNTTDKGYTYGNQNFVNESRTDSQGNKYTVAIPSTISAASLGTTQSTPPLAQPTYNTSGQQAQTAQAQGYTQSAFDSTQALADQEAETARQYAGSGASQLASLQSSLGLKGQDIASQYNQQDETGTSVNSLAGRLRTLNAKSQALGLDTLAKQQEEINKATGQNITQSAVSRNTADVTRENLINQARIAMESAVVKADYDTAKSYADQMIDAKYDGILAEIEAKKTNIQAYKDLVLTPAEKKQADITTRRLDAEQKQAEQKMANEKDISNMIIEATPNAPTSVIANAKKLAESGASKLAVAQALGVYGGDYLKNELLREQLKTEKAQRAKIYSDMGAKGGINTATGQVSTATDLQNATANLKLTEAQSKALAFGQRAINADKALQARLESYDPTTIFSASGRLLRTDNARAFERDLGDFITAVLRKESGATITEDEFDRFIPLYSPQGIMTNKNDIAQTNLKRQGAIDALISEAGPASAALASYKNSNGQGQFVSTGNQLADDYIRQSMNAVSSVNNSMSTPNAVNAGYVDNQK